MRLLLISIYCLPLLSLLAFFGVFVYGRMDNDLRHLFATCMVVSSVIMFIYNCPKARQS